MNAMYPMLKNAHVALMAVSLAGFVLRFTWMMRGSSLLQARWVRIVPHIVDTLLLVSGVALAVTISRYPFVHGWLTAKILGLVAYIVFGTLALKRAPTRSLRLLSFFIALGFFAYIVGAALSHDPASWWAIAEGEAP